MYQYLFSYGTLQIESVQLEVVGRVLNGFADGLPFFVQSVLEVWDGGRTTGGRKVSYPLARYSGRHTDIVRGTAYRVSAAELRRTDKYEGAAYKRVASVLGSGVCAWVYVDVRSSTVRLPVGVDPESDPARSVHKLSERDVR
ncbi:MAG: gamma-glutamylcyclotransferase [Gammaproteobacteria bacterium]|jgi:hypothetical protein